MKRIFYYVYGRSPYLLCIWALLFAGLWELAKRWVPRKYWVLLNRMAAAAYCFVVLYYTLLMRSPAEKANLQLIPLYALIHSAYKMGILESMWLNVALFVPLGIFLGNCFPKNGRKKFRRCIVFCVCFSLFIECTQWLGKLGLAETDDVILNTFGGILGYGLARSCNYLFERKRWIK